MLINLQRNIADAACVFERLNTYIACFVNYSFTLCSYKVNHNKEIPAPCDGFREFNFINPAHITEKFDTVYSHYGKESKETGLRMWSRIIECFSPITLDVTHFFWGQPQPFPSPSAASQSLCSKFVTQKKSRDENDGVTKWLDSFSITPVFLVNLNYLYGKILLLYIFTCLWHVALLLRIFISRVITQNTNFSESKMPTRYPLIDLSGGAVSL